MDWKIYIDDPKTKNGIGRSDRRKDEGNGYSIGNRTNDGFSGYGWNANGLGLGYGDGWGDDDDYGDGWGDGQSSTSWGW